MDLHAAPASSGGTDDESDLPLLSYATHFEHLAVILQKFLAQYLWV